MTDQIPDDLADKVRKLAARFRQQMEPHTPVGEYAVWECAAEAVETLLSPPPRPTLADMTDEERAACQWMQADVKGYESRVVIVNPYWEDGLARVMWLHTRMNPVSWKSVTPRPDLPRLEWPGDKTGPDLPDGFRLADHKDHGRVMVTRTEPDDDGEVCFVAPSVGFLGYGCCFCDPDDLTYLDQEDDTSDAVPESTLSVGTVIKSADDPRIAALPVGSILLDRHEEATTKRYWGWAGAGYAPEEDGGAEFGPWKVLHIPKEDDQ